MTRKVMEKVAKDLRIDLKQYDMVEGAYEPGEKFIAVSFWKDQGIGADRSRHDVRTKRYNAGAIYKAWSLGKGPDYYDYLTGGPRRIFNIK